MFQRFKRHGRKTLPPRGGKGPPSESQNAAAHAKFSAFFLALAEFVRISRCMWQLSPRCFAILTSPISVESHHHVLVLLSPAGATSLGDLRVRPMCLRHLVGEKRGAPSFVPSSRVHESFPGPPLVRDESSKRLNSTPK